MTEMLEAAKWYKLLQEYNPANIYPCSRSTTSKGFSKLMYMIIKDFPIKLIEEYVIQHSDEINLKNNEEWTALMLSARKGKEKTVQLLLENGAEPNLQDNAGWTALILSSRYSGKESTEKTVQLLLEIGADPDLKTDEGWTALMLSSRHSGKESTENTVQLLLKNGA